jgi:hypothetical protein
MAGEKIRHFGLDRLREQRTRPVTRPGAKEALEVRDV